MVSFLKLRRQCGVSHEVQQGAQGASLMAPGKSGLHVRGEGVRVISIEPWKQIRSSRHWCMIFLMCCWILIARILLRIFASMFISDIGL